MWIYKEKEFNEEEVPEQAIGFIYIITNIKSNRKYIGRKLLTKAGVKKKINLSEIKRQKKPARTSSNWKNYYGSCEDLTADLKLIGKEYFKREIIQFAYTQATLNYLEAKYQFLYGVLETNDFYNANINCNPYKRNIIGRV